MLVDGLTWRASIALANQSKMPMMLLLKDACMEKFVSNVHKIHLAIGAELKLMIDISRSKHSTYCHLVT